MQNSRFVTPDSFHQTFPPRSIRGAVGVLSKEAAQILRVPSPTTKEKKINRGRQKR